MKIRCKSTFISHCSTIFQLFQKLFQFMIYFCTHLKSILKISCTYRHDHKFLNIDRIVRMSTSVHDIHHRNRKFLYIRTAKIRIQRQSKRPGRCSCSRKRHAKHGIGSEIGLVLCPVKPDHRLIDCRLIQHVHTYHFRCNPCINMICCLLYAKPSVPFFFIP